ncbi:MAG: TspO/MBR family protein [Patescibacteria group bacterium]
MQLKSLGALVVSLLLVYGAAFLGTYFTVGAIDSWYATLVRPTFAPPNWIFAPVWTLLYALMAIAAWRVYGKWKTNRTVGMTLAVYVVHLAINTLWSIVFFGFHSPLMAFGVIAILWALIIYLTLRFYAIDHIAGILFIPYLLWVSFAAYLNLSIVLLN